MKNIKLTISLLFLSISIFAQNNETTPTSLYQPVKDSIKSYPLTPNAISSNITSIMNFNHSYINIGYERAFFNRSKDKNSYLALEGVIGLILDRENKYPIRQDNDAGYMVRLTSKWITVKDDTSASIIGWSNFFTKHSYDGTKYTHDESEIISYQVNSTVIGTHLLIGKREVHGNFFAEFTTGFGFKYYMVTNNSPVPMRELKNIHRPPDAIQPEENGDHLRLSIALNLKVGVIF